eukprot:TRINITY_DN47643_c0_g1_i2.p1 TRINITY_DN47643_c0_g1~~TRINITY_DN47643_c0_g1_i2.p1  ORF type:complete len:126 (-),score=25.43 TRINITY_DN47643_c0_g1_i2:349-726(-)
MPRKLLQDVSPLELLTGRQIIGTAPPTPLAEYKSLLQRLKKWRSSVFELLHPRQEINKLSRIATAGQFLSGAPQILIAPFQMKMTHHLTLQHRLIECGGRSCFFYNKRSKVSVLLACCCSLCTRC